VNAFAGGRQSVSGDTVTIRAGTVPDTVATLVRRAAAAPGAERVTRFLEFAAGAGIVARTVTGIDLARAELPSHTWAEVFAGNQWVAVDPRYGQAPASVSLLRVVVGGSDRPLVLVPLIGSLRPTTLSIQ
jgi:hypothetical protein